jgi:tetratricopeptide (TPR) repeat protein
MGSALRVATLVGLVTFISGVTVARSETVSGSGVVIGAKGDILTNAHVVEACKTITAKVASGNSETAALVARDERNDLSVIRLTGTNNPPASVAMFREGAPLRAGDSIVVLGYPFSGLLAADANVSVGNVSALAGIADDSRYLQISAPVQPGNSGGPLLDGSGHLVGIVTAKLNALRVARFTGDIPENVNFAIKAEVVRTFLDSKHIPYQTARSDQQLSPADIGDVARLFTVYIECQQASSRLAAAPPTANQPPTGTAAMQQQINWCHGSNLSPPNLIIDGCSAVISQSAPCGPVVCGKSAAWAFNNRAQAYYRKRDYDHAIADFTEVLQLQPNLAVVLRRRAQAYSAKGEYGNAFADWTGAVGLAPNATAYQLLWTYIFDGGRTGKNGIPWAEMNGGENGVPWAEMDRDLATGIAAAHLNREAWPFPVIEFYLGNRSEAEMMSAASTPDEQCEAQFYLGEWHLLRGKRAAATASLRIAVNTCPKNFYEYDGALAELTRLGQKAGSPK